MSIRRAIYLLLFTVLFSALYFSISNTWKWASDFNGLVILVSIPEEDRSLNPYSKDFFWISQDMAVSMIKNMEYPFESCARISVILRGCEQPRIEFTGRIISMVDVETELKLLEVIRFLIQRGESVDAYSIDGYTALQSAILGNSPKLVTLLLEAGANPYLPIHREGELQGKNSVEFVELLSSKNREEFSALRESFYKYMLKKKRGSGAFNEI